MVDDPRTQADKFRDLAGQLRRDEAEKAYKAAVGKIGWAPKPAKLSSPMEE